MIAKAVPFPMAQNLTEDSLLQDCLDGKRLAQKELYHKYCDAMFSIAMRITRDRELSNDCLQEAFIDVFTKLGNYNGSGTIGSWIKTIVVRKATRRIKYEQRFISMDELKHEPQVEYDLYSSQLLDREIAKLPQGARTIFTLTEVEGYKHQEVADLLGISIGTSRSQLHYAKKLLKKALTKES